MSWETVPLKSSLGEWRQPWDELNQHLHQGHPYLDSRFIDTMLTHFGTGTEWLCIHRTNERINGLIILYPRRRGVWTQFSPSQGQATMAMLEKASLLQTLFPCLPRQPVWSIELMRQDPYFAPSDLLEENDRIRLTPYALTMNIKLSGSFDDYWASRSKNLVSNVKRYTNRTQKTFGDIDLRSINSPELMSDAITRYGELESAGWKAAQGTAINANNAQGRFYVEIMGLFAATGQAKVLEYWLGDTLAASRLMISSSSMIIPLKTTYDETLSRFSPGRMQLKELIKEEFSSKDHENIEFYTNASRDQLAWASSERQMFHAMVFRSAFITWLYDNISSKKSRLLNICKKTSSDTKNNSINIVSYRSIGDLPKSCLSLFDTEEKSSFDLSQTWFRILENRSIFTETDARYYTIQEKEGILAVIPITLQHINNTHNKQVTGLSNFYTSLYRPLIKDTISVSQLSLCIQNISKEHNADSVRFDAMDIGHPSFSLLESACKKAGFKPSRFFCFGNWYLPVHGRSYNDYLKSRPSKLSNTIRRKIKKFSAVFGL
ncbi:GNAT family N-acetyltransferase [Pseudomonadota bacterium]